jgi:thioredoxin 1
MNQHINENMHQHSQITRADLDQSIGLVMLEFGASWCGYCQAAQPLIATVLFGYPQLQHIRIEDGIGHHLGRSYAVKLWPTLLFLKDGVELSRLVRPQNAQVIADALKKIIFS